LVTRTPVSFADAVARALPDYPAAPTVLSIGVSNLVGSIKRFTLTLQGMSHTYTKDLNLVLANPRGQSLVLMTYAGGATGTGPSAGGVDLTFDDAAPDPLPRDRALSSGAFRPTAYKSATGLPTPIPGGVRAASLAELAGASGADANGLWRLFIYDDQLGDTGALTNGWKLLFDQETVACCVPGLPEISALADVSTPEDTPRTITFAVNDRESLATDLKLAATSDNPALMPPAGLGFGGVGAVRTLTMTPAPDQSGTARITVTLQDPDRNAVERAFTLTVTAVNDPPTVSAVADQTFIFGRDGRTVAFMLADKESDASALVPFVFAANTNLLPASSLVFGGAGSNRTLGITPALNQVGNTVVTLGVLDPNGATATTTFTVSVVPSQQPTISALPDQRAAGGVAGPPLAFTVGDAETPADRLEVTVQSTNPFALPESALILAGTGSNRTLVIAPPAGRNGGATVTLSVQDADGRFGRTSFFVTVVPTNLPPVVSAIADRVILAGNQARVTFDVSDPDNDPVVVKAKSADPALLPDAALVVAGSGAARRLTVSPAAISAGSTVVTLTLSDGVNLVTRAFLVTVLPQGSVARAADFDEDGKADLVWQHRDGTLAFWHQDGLKRLAVGNAQPADPGDALWRVVGVGDFNADGHPDLVWQYADGTVGVWFMDRTRRIGSSLIYPSGSGDASWKVVAVADVNQDGQPDLLWQHDQGTLGVWFMSGLSQIASQLLNPPDPGTTAWRVVGAGDIDRDGQPDLLWQHQDGTLAVWFMQGAQRTGSALLNPANAGDVGWRVAGVGDFDADGWPDLAWQHNTGLTALWFMQGIQRRAAGFTEPRSNGSDAGWRIAGPR
jgi:subtilisin-like proprotein convertase family protein